MVHGVGLSRVQGVGTFKIWATGLFRVRDLVSSRLGLQWLQAFGTVFIGLR